MNNEQQIISMLMQINANLSALRKLMEKMNEDGIHVRTQQSHA